MNKILVKRNTEIREKFKEYRDAGVKARTAIDHLAIAFDLTVETIQSIIYRKSEPYEMKSLPLFKK